MNKKARVLYIEDDDDSQRLVARVLSNYGYEVLVAPDGLTGVTLARETHPHLVLMDINLPNMDGRAVTTRLRSLPHLVNTPIVALTANTSPGSRELALAAGCIGFLPKPIDVDEFPQQVESFLLGHRQTLTAEIYHQNLERHTQQIVEQLEDKIRQLENANQRLLKLDRMKSNFITLTSHELRTPLALISGYANLLEKQLKQLDAQTDTDAIITIAERMNLGVARMHQIVERIIQVSHSASGAMDLTIEPVYLAQIAAEIAKYFHDVCRQRHLNLHVADMNQLPEIQGDAKQIRTALAHIVENAIKYTPDGGHIYMIGQTMDNAVDLAIQDTGIGIPIEEQQNIFEQFHVLGPIEHHSSSQVAFQGGGLGLGLAVARGIVEAHFGRIWVESEQQNLETLPGSTFHILLPITPPLHSDPK